MESLEFEKIWNLYRTLYPGHHNLNDENLKIVWEVALQPFSLDDVAASVMAWARKKKYFPNIAEITENLTPVEPAQKKTQEKKKVQYTNVSWMAPHIRKLAAAVTDAQADEIHAVGLMTWREAEIAGVNFAEWAREYWDVFPAKEGG